MPPNYEYIFRRAIDLAAVNTPRVLDFGCGRGEVVNYGRSQGYEFFGADRQHTNRPEHFQSTDAGKLQFDDDFFDVVISNQVFEHVSDPQKWLSEISRVLKPGGVFLALFPDKSAWFEGHVGIYFVHWMPAPIARIYMNACYRLGFGYQREGKTADEWVAFFMHELQTDIFYHSPSDLRKWWGDAFGTRPVKLESDFMAFRLEHSGLRRLASLAGYPITARALSFVCRKRAGLVWLTPQTR